MEVDRSFHFSFTTSDDTAYFVGFYAALESPSLLPGFASLSSVVECGPRS